MAQYALAGILETSDQAFLQVADTPETMSGYKLHVYAESVADVLDAWERVRSVVEERGLAAKLATDRFFQAYGTTPQGHKGVTVYLPRRSSFQQDARAVLRALDGYRHTATVEGDGALSNGAGWRFEFSEDPRRNLSLEAYAAAYAPAHHGQPAVPPIAVYPDMALKLRDHQGDSLSFDVLAMLARNREYLEALATATRENDKASLAALDSPLLSGPFDPRRVEDYDDLLVSALTQFGADAEPRMHRATSRSAGVTLTAGTGFPAADAAVFELLAPYALPATVEARYGHDVRTYSFSRGELAIEDGGGIVDLSATLHASALPKLAYQSMAVRIRGADGGSQSYAALQSLRSIRGSLERSLSSMPFFTRGKLDGLRSPLLSRPADSSLTFDYDGLLADTLVRLGFEATVRERAGTGASAGVKITRGSGSETLDGAVLGALAPFCRDTSFTVRSAGRTTDYAIRQGALETPSEPAARAPELPGRG